MFFENEIVKKCFGKIFYCEASIGNYLSMVYK
jgi:hypothetical protein